MREILEIIGTAILVVVMIFLVAGGIAWAIDKNSYNQAEELCSQFTNSTTMITQGSCYIMEDFGWLNISNNSCSIPMERGRIIR